MCGCTHYGAFTNKLGGISIFNIRLLPVFFITSIIERICFGELDVYLSSMAIVIIILVNANKIQVTHFDGLQFIGGNLSSNIYYYHILIKLIIIDIVGESIANTLKFKWILPIIVTIFSIMASYCIYRIKGYRKSNLREHLLKI